MRNGVTIFGSFIVSHEVRLRRHGRDAAGADHRCAKRRESLFEELIAAVDVLQAADLRRPLGGQRGKHERTARPDIRRFDHGILELGNAAHVALRPETVMSAPMRASSLT